MSPDNNARRRFLKEFCVMAGSAVVAARSAVGGARAEVEKLHVACNQYPWITFYRRQGRNFQESPDAGLAEVARSGADGYEPLVTTPEEVDRLAPLLEKHGLAMRSLYVNSTLHEANEINRSIDFVLAVAEKAKPLGTRIIVTNPSPIRWGGPENKNDAQLEVQAEALDRLGSKLKAAGLVLAYHNHDIELRNAAREFHHMMLGTDPERVTLCLDAHWIYRGSGDSAVALFDVIELYGRRVTELHARQSSGGVWTETLCDGDVDYPKITERLLAVGVKPHLVLEQAVEKATPETLNAVEAHRRSRQYAEEVFARFAGMSRL